jgi:hypothetical protein
MDAATDGAICAPGVVLGRRRRDPRADGNLVPPWDRFALCAADPNPLAVVGWEDRGTSAPSVWVAGLDARVEELLCESCPQVREGIDLDQESATVIVGLSRAERFCGPEVDTSLDPSVQWVRCEPLRRVAYRVFSCRRTTLFERVHEIRRRLRLPPAGANHCPYCRRPGRCTALPRRYGLCDGTSHERLCHECGAREAAWLARPERGGRVGSWRLVPALSA